MTSKATICITQAYWSLGDHFSRLSGSARYRNMPESDIPLFIGCELAQRISEDFNTAEYLPFALLDAATPAIATVRAHLSLVDATPEELSVLLIEFIANIDGKYKSQHRSQRWENLIAWAHKRRL